MNIKKIIDNNDKINIAKNILNQLPEYFGDKDSLNEYVDNTKNEVMYIVEGEQSEVLGFVSLKITSEESLEIAVMGVLYEFQNLGVGTHLVTSSKRYAADNGYKFLQVKTIAEGYYPQYDKTNKFYQGVGFSKLEVLESLWGANMPCQIYVQTVNK